MSNPTEKGKAMSKRIKERAEANRVAYEEAFGGLVMSADERIKAAASGSEPKPRRAKKA